MFSLGVSDLCGYNEVVYRRNGAVNSGQGGEHQYIFKGLHKYFPPLDAFQRFFACTQACAS